MGKLIVRLFGSVRLRAVALALVFVCAGLPAVAFAQPRASALDAVQVEGDVLWFKLQLDAAAGPGGATFNVRTVDDTAIAGEDYRALPPQTVTIPAGERDADIYVMALQDQQAEPDETLRLQVQPLSGVDPAPLSAVGTITDASTTALPVIDVQGSDVVEGDSGAKPMLFTFRLTEPSARTVAFMYQTSGGNGGHAAVVGRAFFAPGETVATVAIQVYGDTEPEDEERVVLHLFDPINATLAATQATGEIRDDDRLPYLQVVELAVVEGDAGNRDATVEVTLDAPSYREVRVGYATVDRTAMSEEDYIAVSGTLVFAPGERSKTVTVTIRGDLDDEPTERFSLELSDPVGAVIDNHGIIYIVTDDGGARSIQPPTLPDGALGERYDQLFYVEGQINAQFEIVSGALPPGIALTLFNGRTYAIGIPTATGTFAFSLAARLGPQPGDWLAQRSYTLTVGGPTLALPPTTLPDADYRGNYAAILNPATGGQTPYRYAITGGALPPGLQLQESGPQAGTISGMATRSGSFTFTVTATDSSPAGPYTASREYTLQVLPPVLQVEALDPLSGTEGAPFEARFAVIGGANEPFRFAVTAGRLPAGLRMNENGLIAGIALEAGEFPITVTVTDSTANVPGSGSAAFVLTIEAAALRLAPSTLSRAVVGTFYSQTFTVSGGEGPYEFELSGGTLPSGITLQADGRLVGTPETPGLYDFTLLVRDLASVNGPVEGWTFTLEVVDGGLQFPTAQLAPASAGVPYQATLSAQGGVAPWRYAVIDGALPPGIGLDENGVLSGTPQAVGEFRFQVRAIDANGAMVVANPLHTLVVGAPGLRLGPARPQPAVVGSDYSLTLQAEGGQAPYRYALITGALPPGLQLSEAGVIAGVPLSAGSHVVTIAATDASAPFGPLRGTLEYTLVVEPAAATGAPAPDATAAAPVAASRTLELWAGTATTVDLTAGAQGGPFTDAEVVSVSPASAGSATIERGADGPRLRFVPAAQAAGRIELRYILRNAHGVSAPATLVLVLRARPDPAREAQVIRALDLQLRSARRFADAQIGNVRDRLERVRAVDGDDVDRYGGFDNSLRMLAARPCAPTVGAIPGRACGFERDANAPRSNVPDRANPPFGLWAAGTVRPANHDGRNPADRLGFETDGLSFGADFRPGARSVLGFGLGYARDGGAFAADDDDGRSRSEALGLTVYGGLRLGERGFVDALVGQQRLGFDLRRGDDATGTAWHGRRAGDQWFVALSVGADFDRAAFDRADVGADVGRGGWRVVPYARLEAGRVRLGDYVEASGRADAIPLQAGIAPPPLAYDRLVVSRTSLDFGLRIEYRRDIAWGSLAPRFRAEYRHDLDTDGVQRLGYADLPDDRAHRAIVSGFARRRLELSAGLRLDVGRGWSLDLDWRAPFGDADSARDRSLQFGVQARF